jgi:DNA-binding protein HU-beta
MNKAELISAIAQKASITKTDAKKALAASLEAISEALTKGNKVTLIGFGTFTVIKRAPRTSRVPLKGTVVSVPAKKVVKFKPGLALGADVNK